MRKLKHDILTESVDDTVEFCKAIEEEQEAVAAARQTLSKVALKKRTVATLYDKD